jgi:hypothetical protein
VLRFLGRWIFRITVVLGLVFMAVYVGDWAVFRLRGSPMDKVTVSRYVAIPLKAQKTEYDYLGTMDVPCSEALFMQAGQSPCWQLRRHPNQGATF